MNIQINNRLEAFLYWKVTGIKPQGWDLTPRNKEEEYLAATCNRIDEIAGGGPTPPTPGSKDYNDYINKPIEPYPTEIEEKDFEDLTAGDTLHIDVTKPIEMELFLKGLTYSDDDGQQVKFLVSDPNADLANNTLMALIYPKEFTHTDNDAYILQFVGDADNRDMYLIYSTEGFTISTPGGDQVIPQGFNFDGYMPIPIDGNIEIKVDYEQEMVIASEMSEQSLIKLFGTPALDNNLYYYKKGEPAHMAPLTEGMSSGYLYMTPDTFTDSRLALINYDDSEHQSSGSATTIIELKQTSSGPAMPYCAAVKGDSTMWTGIGTCLLKDVYFNTDITVDFSGYTFEDHQCLLITYTNIITNEHKDLIATDDNKLYLGDILIYDNGTWLINHYQFSESINYDTLEGFYLQKQQIGGTINFVSEAEPGKTVYAVAIFIIYVHGPANMGVKIFDYQLTIFDDQGNWCGLVDYKDGEVNLSSYTRLPTVYPFRLDLSDQGDPTEFIFSYINPELSLVDYIEATPDTIGFSKNSSLQEFLTNDTRVVKHNIELNYSANKIDNCKVVFDIINNQTTPMTVAEIKDYLYNNGYTSTSNKFYGANGTYSYDGGTIQRNCCGLIGWSSNYIGLCYYDQGSYSSLDMDTSGISITDNIEILL